MSATRRIACTIFTALLCSVAACTAGEDDDAALDGVEATSDALTGSITAGSTLTTTARVNLREGPSTSAGIIRTMPKGATLKAIATGPTNGFYNVEHEGEKGWAYGVYLKTTSVSTPPSGGDDDGDGAGTGTGNSSGGVTGTFNGRTFSNVTVLWQGNWSFLIQCDSYSRGQGKVVFFCDENPGRTFVDQGAWLAMPGGNFTRSMCGQQAKVCKGSNCIVAKVVEKSVTGAKWEGSTAVLKTLGVDTGFSSCTSSHGTATGVTITMQ